MCVILDLNTWKLEAKTATEAGLKFKTTGVHNTDNGKVLGVLETEYNCKDYGEFLMRLLWGFLFLVAMVCYLFLHLKPTLSGFILCLILNRGEKLPFGLLLVILPISMSARDSFVSHGAYWSLEEISATAINTPRNNLIRGT